MPSTDPASNAPGPSAPEHAFDPRSEDEVSAPNIVKWAHGFVAPSRLKERAAWQISEIGHGKAQARVTFLIHIVGLA
jgi:hypothetical protein